MSFAEIKENAAILSATQRLELASFLAELDDRDEERFNEAIEKRMAEIDSGKKVSMSHFESEHLRLKAEGR